MSQARAPGTTTCPPPQCQDDSGEVLPKEGSERSGGSNACTSVIMPTTLATTREINTNNNSPVRKPPKSCDRDKPGSTSWDRDPSQSSWGKDKDYLHPQPYLGTENSVSESQGGDRVMTQSCQIIKDKCQCQSWQDRDQPQHSSIRDKAQPSSSCRRGDQNRDRGKPQADQFLSDRRESRSSSLSQSCWGAGPTGNRREPHHHHGGPHHQPESTPQPSVGLFVKLIEPQKSDGKRSPSVGTTSTLNPCQPMRGPTVVSMLHPLFKEWSEQLTLSYRNPAVAASDMSAESTLQLLKQEKEKMQQHKIKPTGGSSRGFFNTKSHKM